MIGQIQRVLIDRTEADYGEDAVASTAKQAGMAPCGHRTGTDASSAASRPPTTSLGRRDTGRRRGTQQLTGPSPCA